MLTRKRTPSNGPFRASVAHFLSTGEIALQPGDNPWQRISLLDVQARAARDLWRAGDIEAARAALDRCPGRPGWYLD